jgi:NADH:ubiquinone oxidoreductase subunit 4 (subunit M)
MTLSPILTKYEILAVISAILLMVSCFFFLFRSLDNPLYQIMFTVTIIPGFVIIELYVNMYRYEEGLKELRMRVD